MTGMKNRQRQAGVKSHFRRNMYLYSFILTVLIILGALTFYLLRTELLKNTQDLGDALARSYSSEERNNLTVYETLLDFGTEIYDSPGQADRPEEEKEQMLKIFFRRIENTLGAGKVNPYAVIGGRIVSHNSWEGAEEYEAEEAEWYQRAMDAGGKAAFTGVYTDAVYGRPVITISRKCDSADVVLALDIFPENFQFQFNPPDLPENASFYLCDENGTLIYAKSAMTDDEEEAGRYALSILESIRRGEQDSYDAYMRDAEGNRRGVYYDYLPNGWISIITVPFATILQKLNYLAAVFLGIVGVGFVGIAVLVWRDARLNARVRRTNEAVRVLGNSYFALYRINFAKGTYEMIKGSDYVRERIPEEGDYKTLLEVMKELIEPEAYDEYMENFSLASIRSLVARRMRDFGGDFRRLFGTTYRWMNVRMLFDESLSPEEVVLCFREVEEEKQRRFQEQKLLEEALEASRRSEKNKHAFFSNMSHDMRTPLNAIIGLSELVRQNLGDQEKVSDYMDQIDLSSRQLLSLINDILDMSRMEQGKVALDYQQFNLKKCVEDCVATFRIQAQLERKNLELSFDLEDETVLGDSVRISQIMNNLLSNALKFTGEGDDIRVSVSQFANQNVAKYKIVVADTGIGMSKDFLPQLFEPYARETRFGVKKVSGTGLGMPIVKNLVTQMSGQIHVESELGKGTAFTIVIPFEAVKEEKEEKKLPAEDSGSPAFALAGRTVLLAEDNAINMEIATEILTMSGMKIIQAWNGQEAVERFKESAPFAIDVILMDMQMPKMDGCEAARNIRVLSRPDARAVPIIAVTANAFAEDIAATTAAGMDAHVSKPIDFKILEQTMENLMDGGKKRE